MEYLTSVIRWIVSVFVDAFSIYKNPVPSAPTVEPPTAPVAPNLPPVSVPLQEPNKVPMYDFSTQKAAYHSTRVICDEVGLTYDQKNILCACIYQESTFLNYRSPGVPVTNGNKDKNGKVWSTDFGICQVNDYFQCGPGKTFPSVNYVMQHPDEVVRWMAGIMKRTGALQPWASYTTKAYLKWLNPKSPMWALKS